MSKPFEIGETVAVYSSQGRDICVVQHIGQHLTVSPYEMNRLSYPAHPKQCRRLVKKKRKEVWIIKGSCEQPRILRWNGFDGDVNYGETRFIEAKK